MKKTNFTSPGETPVVLAPGITSTPGVCSGLPCFANTRLPVKYVAGVARYHGKKEALRTYPQLSEKEVAAAVEFIRKNPQYGEC